MLTWLRKSMRGSAPALSAGLSAIDDVFHPNARHAHELAEAEHTRVVRQPLPGDRLLDDGVLVMQPPQPEPEGCERRAR